MYWIPQMMTCLTQPEPYPQNPPETDMHERQKSQAVGMAMTALQRPDALARIFVSMCASLFPFMKAGGILFLCIEKIH